jgi:hypothetical protein
MKLAILARTTVLVLVAVLSVGPVVSFAQPTMSVGQDAASQMAMSDSQVMIAQANCTGCGDAVMAMAMMGGYCSIACLSLVTLPDGLTISERPITPQWATASVAEPPGITTTIDPYPPNLLS